MKAICSGPGELSLCGKPATKRLLTRAIFACCKEHADIIMVSERNGLDIPAYVNPWVDCEPEVELYGLRSTLIQWACENGGDDLVGTKEEMEIKAIEFREGWDEQNDIHPALESFYEVQPYEGEHEKFVTPQKNSERDNRAVERLLGEVSLDLANPVECVRLLAGLTLGQLVDKVTVQRCCTLIDAATIVENAENSGGDVRVEDFMMIAEACGFKVKAFLFTKD